MYVTYDHIHSQKDFFSPRVPTLNEAVHTFNVGTLLRIVGEKSSVHALKPNNKSNWFHTFPTVEKKINRSKLD